MSKTQIALIGGLLALDSALSLFAVCYLGWRVMFVETCAAALLGLAVMVLAACHYGDAIAARLDNDACLDGQLIHGPALMLAGLLLACPGMITDLVAVALLVPAVRRLALGAVRKQAEVENAPILRFEQPSAQKRRLAA
jgi:UPF0716 family protein affecting phage T7 exclusion